MQFAVRTPRTVAAFVLLTIAMGASAVSASAASPVVLGAIGSNSSDSASYCTAFGLSTSGATDYTIPYDGVFTGFKVQTGVNHSPYPPQTATLRTVRVTGAAGGGFVPAVVISEGTAQSVDLIPNGGVGFFDDRVAATAGDRLGVAISVSGGYALNTQCTATSPNFTDVAAHVPAATVGVPDSHWIDDASSNLRLPNIMALLEPDADGDGYGDGSQDLCPADPNIHAGPCGGSLVGTPIAGEQTSSSSQCLFECIRTQMTLGGVSTAAPFSGVIVRWRAAAQSTTQMRIRIIKPTDATHFQIMRSSDLASIVASAGGAQLPPTIVTVPTRIPIDAGDYVGLGMTTTPISFYRSDATSSFKDFQGLADGQTVGSPAGTGQRIFYNADVEPDIDHDGYGDVTQDFCPTDASIQTPCPLPGDASIPVITQFKMLFKGFRVKPKGLIISNRAHPGTTVSLNLSEPSTVAFTVEKAFRGKITKGVCKKAGESNRKNRRCTKYILVHKFSRSLGTGVNSFPYSGRYSSNSKVGTLKPGPYRLTAVPTDIAGNVGAPDYVAFKVRH